MKILIEGAKILLGNRELKRCDIIVNTEKGIIEKIGLGFSKKDYDRKIKLDDRFIILPGFVDIHVHCRDWQQSHKETIETCTRAAAAGGVVKVFDMPNTVPRIETSELYVRRIEEGRKRSLVEYNLHAGVPKTVDELYKYGRVGARSVKVYPEDIERLENEDILEEFFKICNELNMLVILHCEDNKIIRKRLLEYEHDFKYHKYIRCRESELSCISNIISRILRSGYANLKIHFTHVSVPESVDLICRFKKKLDITLDVTPHHILLSDEECFERNIVNICKVNPPLRSSRDRDRLLTKFLTGMIDCVVSDHAPHICEEKYREYDSCPPGFPGLETTSTLLLSLWRLGLIDLVDVVKLYCENPCKIVNIDHPKISEGSFADFCIIDPKVEYTIDPSRFKSLAKYTPFKGFKVHVRVVSTFYHGKAVYVDDYYVDYFSVVL